MDKVKSVKSEIEEYIHIINKLLEENKVKEIDDITSKLEWYDFVKVLKSGIYDKIADTLKKEKLPDLFKLFQKWNTLIKEHKVIKQTKTIVTPSPLAETPPLPSTTLKTDKEKEIKTNDTDSISSSKSETISDTGFPVYWDLHKNLGSSNLCRILSEKKLEKEEIERRRKYIYSNIKNYLGLSEENLQEPEKLQIFFNTIDKIDSDHFWKNLLDLYDKIFFENTIQDYFCASNCDLHICWNKRCTSIGGRCTLRWQVSPRSKIKKKNIKIELSSKVFYNSFDKIKSNFKIVNGLKCNDVLSCLMLVFEHELVHAIIQCTCFQDVNKNYGIWTGPIGTGGHGKIFMSITNNLFGHTTFFHELLSVVSSKLQPISLSWNPYKNLRKGYLIKYNFTNRKAMTNVITEAKVMETGGRRTKKLIVKNLENGSEWEISYLSIISYRDSSGILHEKYI